jgi:hypothetical protein
VQEQNFRCGAATTVHFRFGGAIGSVGGLPDVGPTWAWLAQTARPHRSAVSLVVQRRFVDGNIRRGFSSDVGAISAESLLFPVAKARSLF